MPTSSKPRPSEVAQETKRHYIPLIREQYADHWPTHSYLFPHPAQQIPLGRCLHDLTPPAFSVRTGDPVDLTIEWELARQSRIPFICAANDKRPGGDWETGVVGYEERLCRRSTLSATLATPGPSSEVECNYPIPSEGCIFSECVVVFRGPHEQYKKLEQWYDLPVVSVPAARWPKLSNMGTKYAFDVERSMVRNKIRAALTVCAYYGYRDLVIGDLGLGNSYRNPPVELAELWREVFLWDPDFRGRFDYVAFVFEDSYQSTTRLIMEDIAKKSKGSSSASKSKSKSHSSSSSSVPTSATPSDFDIFRSVFDESTIQSVLARPDPRCNISMLTS